MHTRNDPGFGGQRANLGQAATIWPDAVLDDAAADFFGDDVGEHVADFARFSITVGFFVFFGRQIALHDGFAQHVQRFIATAAVGGRFDDLAHTLTTFLADFAHERLGKLHGNDRLALRLADFGLHLLLQLNDRLDRTRAPA